MKKVVLLVVALVMMSFACNNAQAQTRIGKEHVVDLGLHYGYGPAPLCNMGGLNVDFNMASNNLRFRLDLDMLQRPVSGKPGCFGGAFNVQYLFPMAKDDADGFYFYPSLGFGCDFNKGVSGWDNKGNCGIGFNAGLGFEYQMNSRWGIFVEGDYQVRFQSAIHRPCFRIGFEFGL